MKIMLLILICTSFLACNTSGPDTSDNINLDYLTQEWVHSFEEETDSVQIFRPADFMEFPAARYREKIIIEPDGGAAWLILAPNDAHYFENGSWKYAEKNRQLTLIDSSNTQITTFEVLRLEPDVLEIIPVIDLN